MSLVASVSSAATDAQSNTPLSSHLKNIGISFAAGKGLYGATVRPLSLVCWESLRHWLRFETVPCVLQIDACAL